MTRRGPGSNATSQRERLLRWALAGGTLHQDNWYVDGPDGGPGIRAVRSRIPELEAEGYGFHHTARPDGTVEYKLAYVPEHPATRAPKPEPRVVPDVDDPRLFDPAPAPAEAAMHDWDNAA